MSALNDFPDAFWWNGKEYKIEFSEESGIFGDIIRVKREQSSEITSQSILCSILGIIHRENNLPDELALRLFQTKAILEIFVQNPDLIYSLFDKPISDAWRDEEEFGDLTRNSKCPSGGLPFKFRSSDSEIWLVSENFRRYAEDALGSYFLKGYREGEDDADVRTWPHHSDSVRDTRNPKRTIH